MIGMYVTAFSGPLFWYDFKSVNIDVAEIMAGNTICQNFSFEWNLGLSANLLKKITEIFLPKIYVLQINHFEAYVWNWKVPNLD